MSFALLWGKCRNCHKPISPEYPLIEFITGSLFLVSFYFFSKDNISLYFGYFLISFLILFVFSDAKWRLLPHIFNNLFSLTGIFFKTFKFFYFRNEMFIGVSHFIIVGAVMVCLIQIVPNGLGGGDIKMVAGLVFWVGLLNAIFILFFASVLALTLFLILLSFRKVNWKWMIPFGPFLALATLLVWFFPNLTDQLNQIY